MTLPTIDCERIENEVEKTLESFDSLESISPSPFFYSRLRNAIAEAEAERFNWFYRLTRGYKLLPATLLVIVVMNVVSLSLALSMRESTASVGDDSRYDTAQVFSLSQWHSMNQTGR